MNEVRNFSFVIPTYNHYHLLHQCLYDIYQKCSPVLEVIVVNNGSSDVDYYEGLKWWAGNGLLSIRVVKIPENVGFLKASNIGLKKATGDIVCLLSNDVRLYGDIVREIQEQLSHYSDTFVGGRLLDFDTGWNTFNGEIFSYLEGWLLATWKEGWIDLGYFDERFAPSDMEDVDISTTAISKGYELFSLPTQMTHHIGGQTLGFNPAREEITIANKEKFRKKWVENAG